MFWRGLALLALLATLADSRCMNSVEESTGRTDCYTYESKEPVAWHEPDNDCEEGDDESGDGDSGEGDQGHSITKRNYDDFDDYFIKVKPARLHHRFDVLLNYSILFYEAQKSGRIPSAQQAFDWRATSAMDDKGFMQEDLSGGWYDAGDNVKFNYPMAWSTAVLAWGLIEFPDAYKSAGAYEDMLLSIRWTCDYFIKCHTRTNEYYYQVADANVDHTYWQRPEDIVYYREPYRIRHTETGSDAIASAAAALATCAVAYKDAGMGGRSRIYRDEAMDLYRLATRNIGKYPATNYYINNNLGDELVWAATWVHLATGDPLYLSEAEAFYEEYSLNGRSYAFGWGDTREGSKLLLYQITGNTRYSDSFMKYMDAIMPFNNPLFYTPRGLFFRHEWGSLRYAAGASFVGLIGAKYGLRPNVYREFACNQTNYMLGDNVHHSFVIGYGVDPPCKPHHRASSCPDLDIPCTNANSWNNPGCNHHELVGALVGGPNQDDWWADDRKDYYHNEVACDYNAGFQGVMAGLLQLDMDRSLPPACFILTKRVHFDN